MKFKNIKIIVLLVIMSLTACNDATEIVQDGTVTDDVVWRSLDDLQLGLNGVYGAYDPEFEIQFNAIFTDNIKEGLANNGQGQSLYNFLLIPATTEAENIWFSKYITINNANRVLGGIEDLEFDTTAETNQENNIEAELLTLRALAHLDLFLYYTPDYNDPSGLSIPILDYVPEIDDQPTRNTVAEVLQFIKNDLENASALIGSSSDNFRVNINTIQAIQARIALIEGDYQRAINLSEALVSSFPLSEPEEYINMYLDEASGESIFTLGRGQGDGQEIPTYFYFNPPAGIDGDPFLEVSNGLFNELNEDDVRFDVIIHPESQIVAENSPENIILLNKYPGSNSGGPRINDIKWIRSSEMQLISAEAKARAGDLAGAAQAVKELRDVRFGSEQSLPSYSNLTNALTDILEERRVEFAFEGKRYLDIKRIGPDINTGINRNETDCASFSAPCSLGSTDYRFTLPIPQGELNGNNAIQQNTGY